MKWYPTLFTVWAWHGNGGTYEIKWEGHICNGEKLGPNTNWKHRYIPYKPILLFQTANSSYRTLSSVTHYFFSAFVTHDASYLHEIYSLLWSDTVQFGESLPIFRKNCTYNPKIKEAHPIKTSAINYQTTCSHLSEDSNQQVLILLNTTLSIYCLLLLSHL
jgi:hypothetical protein